MRTALAVAIVTAVAVLRCERYAAKHLSGRGRTNGDEAADAEDTTGLWQRGRMQDVSDFHQLVGIGTLISARADGRSHCVDVYRAIAMDLAGDVAATVRCGIECDG